MPKFKFDLRQPVKIKVSGETGEVQSRLESVGSNNQYLMYYRSTDGRAIETWWNEAQLAAVPKKPTPARKRPSRATKK